MPRIILPKPATGKSRNPAGDGPLRIGELLVQENLLTTEQVNEAIEAQYLYGSRLGTSLLELGFIDEETLAQTLSKKLYLPYIEPEELMAIPEETLALVPAEIATKHLVVPCQQDGKKLYLAMADPTNLATIDALSFQLNMLIVPVVVPEIRLMFALHKFYRFNLSPRIQILSKHMLNQKVKKADKKSSSPWQEERILRPQAKKAKSFSGLNDMGVKVLSDLSPAAQKKTVDFSPNFSIQQNKPTAIAGGAENKALKRLSYQECCDLLADVRTRDDLAQTVLNYFSTSVATAALLMVKTGQIVGWRALANRAEVPGFNQLFLSLEQESTLRKVVESRRYYLGPPAQTEQDMKLLKSLGAQTQDAMLLVPLIIKNRFVGLLYLQDQMGVLSEKIDESHQLVGKISMALEILILRGKIRSA